MSKTFQSQIRLESVSDRTHSLIDTLNSSTSVASAMMVVLDASPVPGSQEQVEGKIQLINDDLKVTFGVIAPTMEYLSAFASRFNMGSSMDCTIRYRLIGEGLNLTFKPPDEREEVLRDFFELTEKSSNWIVENDNSVWQHIIYPTDSHWVSVGINLKKKKYFARSISFWFYYYSADSSVSGAS